MFRGSVVGSKLYIIEIDSVAKAANDIEALVADGEIVILFEDESAAAKYADETVLDLVLIHGDDE